MDYVRKKIVFHTLDGQRICFIGETNMISSCMILALTVNKLIRKECESFLACAISSEGNDSNLADILVVCRFLDVFFEELLRLPPAREIKSSIDLVSDTRPTSKALYRMAPTELKELKA